MAIPKIIHYCWLGGNPKPESVLKCIESWKRFCPDYEIKEWNETNLNLELNWYAKEAYDACAWGFVPDFFRLWIVYNYGGIYLDTDVQIIRSFNTLLDNRAFAGFENDEFVSFGLGFGAEAGSEIIRKQMDVYEDLHFINEDGSLNRKPGPMYATDLLMSLGLQRNTGKPQTIMDMVCYPPEYFAPKDFKTGFTKITKKTYSIHQYDSSWYTPEEAIQYKKNLRRARINYIIYFPNRVIQKIIGKKRYEAIVKEIKLFLHIGM